MHPRWRFPATALIGFLFLPIAAQKDDDNRPRYGRLVVVGGGNAVPAIYRRALEIAGGTSAHIVVLPQASSDLGGTAERCLVAWKAAGAQCVEPILDLTADKARQALEVADLIWFSGGSQTRLMESLKGTGMLELVRQRYRSGAVVGGTSAGAAILSQVMISGPAGPRGTPESRLARIDEGIGLWPEAVVDQHFLKRNREERLRRVVAENPSLVGVGIDEGTAVIVRGSKLEVVGDSRVVILDARKLPHAIAPHGPSEPSSQAPIESYMLEPGDCFDLETGTLAKAAGR